MRTLISLAMVAVLGLSSARGQDVQAGTSVVGTWSGPAACKHGDGETFTMTIPRDDRGQLVGTMDWALVGSDGRRGPGIPLTTLTVAGTSLTATAKRDGHEARLDATVNGDTITGKWTTAGVDDVWTFKGKRLPRS